jgi:dynein heavy chain
MIGLSDRMTIMFEVEDLEVASPATVSRCGMIYMEPQGLTPKDLFRSWCFYLPPSFLLRKTTIPQLETLFLKYIPDMIELVRYFVKEPCVSSDNALI